VGWRRGWRYVGGGAAGGGGGAAGGGWCRGGVVLCVGVSLVPKTVVPTVGVVRDGTPITEVGPEGAVTGVGSARYGPPRLAPLRGAANPPASPAGEDTDVGGPAGCDCPGLVVAAVPAGAATTEPPPFPPTFAMVCLPNPPQRQVPRQPIPEQSMRSAGCRPAAARRPAMRWPRAGPWVSPGHPARSVAAWWPAVTAWWCWAGLWVSPDRPAR